MNITHGQNEPINCTTEVEQNDATSVQPIVRDEDKQSHAESLTDTDLCSYIEKAFEQSKSATSYNLPYLAEARKRFAKPGRRVPVSGQPSWTEWIAQHVGITDRHVRRLLAEYREQQAIDKDPVKAAQQRLEAEQKKAEAAKRRAEAKQNREEARKLTVALAGKALLAIGDMISAYEDGVDMEPAYQQYKNVAVSPAELHSIFEAATSGHTKSEINGEVKKKLVPVVETAERYIRALESLVYSPSVTLSEDQKKLLPKPMEDWRSILRYARGVQAERTGIAISTENAPVALAEVA